MKNVRSIVFFSAILLVFSCSMSAKPEKGKDDNTASSKVIELNKAEFLKKVFNYEKSPEKWVYEGDKPCIIDFYATWCGPCKKQSPILNQLAKEYEGKIVFYKVDTDKEYELARTFNIQGLPSLLFVPMEGKPTIAAGFKNKAGMVKLINELILTPKAAQ